MNGNQFQRSEAMQRIETLRAALRVSVDNARHALDTTRGLRTSEDARCSASMQRLDLASKALHASVGLID